MSRLENVYRRGYCMECGNPIEYCCCDELAFTSDESVIELQRRKSVRKRKAMNFKPAQDCSECSSYSCTECPRYTTY